MKDRDYDVIVVGGGPAGVATAYCLAKLGKSVIILDKKSRDQIGNKTCGDALDKAAPQLLYDEFGLDMPHGEEVSDKVTKLSVQTTSTTVTLEAPGYTVDRLKYGQRLLRDCEAIGVVVKSNAPVREVLFENGFVVGVKYVDVKNKQKLEVRAPLIADCSGIIGAVRKNLPEGFSQGIHAKIPDYHIAATYREIVDLTSDHDYDEEIVLGYAPSIPPPGYLWFFTKGEKQLNIGTGWLKSENKLFDRSMKEIYRSALDGYMVQGKDYEISVKGGGQIPIRPPFDSLVFNGGLLVGDAGCMVDPTTAEGHGIALVAGYQAAKTLNNALDNHDFSVQSLWNYNVEIMHEIGRRNAISYVLLQYLRELEADGMDIVLRKRLLTEAEIKAVFRGEEAKMNLFKILEKIIRAFPNYKVLFKLYQLSNDIDAIAEIYESYPSSPSHLEAWQKRRDEFLGEEL